MKRVDFVFFDAGGGHRSAATALKSVVEQQQRPWSVRLVNLQEVLEPLDIFRKLTGVRMEDIYNNMLKRGRTLGSEYLVPAMHGVIRLYHPAQRRMLAEFWRRDRPNMVVSVVPNFNRAFYQALRLVDPAIPLVTILTDLADYPPHFWMEKQDQYIIVGSDRAVQQAQEMGYDPRKVLRVSGMILRPEFYQPFDMDRRAERTRIGLDPDLPTGIVLFGGQGAAVMEKIVERLDRCERDLQLILVCGRNERLAEKLRGKRIKKRSHVVGFTREIPYYMQLSDFLIGKPGPGSISEALAMKLPVVIEKNAWTLPQERYNADWVRENGLGLVLRNFTGIADAVSKLLDPGELAAFRARVAAVQNQAVFEIPDLLQAILDAHEKTLTA
jgi:1,2-diacylglycerol 3-beta-galactosyltransferase